MKRSQRCKLLNSRGDIQMHEWLASQSYKAKTSLINPDRLLIKYFADKQAPSFGKNKNESPDLMSYLKVEKGGKLYA